MGKVIGAIALVFWAGISAAQEVTIAALGDSLTQGYGLPAEDGFVPQLETWLTDQGLDARVINAGVSGDTTAGGLSRAAWTLTQDVDAMIVALGGNDLLRGIDPAISRANLRGILQAARMAEVPVLLIGMQAPGNYGPEYKAAFDAIYPELAAEFGVMYLESFFDGLGGAGTDPADIRAFMQADGIHPNATGVTRIVDGIGPHAAELFDAAR
jgi:acyl-CoA thioesterase-1